MRRETLPRTGIWRISAVLALFCSGVGFVLLAQAHSAATPQIETETDLVVLPVRVTDTKGNFVAGLNQGQFRVFENNRRQEISLFRQEDVPVAVGLVVDHSRSMGPKLPAVAQAVLAFAHSSNPDDEMFVVDFSDRVTIEEPGGKPFTQDPQLLSQAVSAVSAQGMTSLYDAVLAALDHLRLSSLEKKALIIVSDGGDNASAAKYADVLEGARRSQVLVYAIGLVRGAEQADENPGLLRRLCRDTGGLSFFPAETESVSEVSAKIARDLREQYTVGFSPGKRDGDSFRRVRVEISASQRGKLQVRTRPGYYAPGHDRLGQETGEIRDYESGYRPDE